MSNYENTINYYKSKVDILKKNIKTLGKEINILEDEYSKYLTSTSICVSTEHYKLAAHHAKLGMKILKRRNDLYEILIQNSQQMYEYGKKICRLKQLRYDFLKEGKNSYETN